MTKVTRRRLFFLVLLLGALAGVLSTPAEQTAYAVQCCDSCSYVYYTCTTGASHPVCQSDPDCCSEKSDRCFTNCIVC
jgi:hypothetical protein